MSIKGKLILAGGNENKGNPVAFPDHRNEPDFFESGILRIILRETSKKDPRLEIITTASEIPEETGKKYLEIFGLLGCENTGIISIREKDEADTQDYIQRIGKADAILFSGGDQMRLTQTFSGTQFLDILKARLQEKDFVLAGTSAGAMAMSTLMIYPVKKEDLNRHGGNIYPGLGFISNMIIDTHFINRKRFGRLTRAVASKPDFLGAGLGEDTGLIITDGNRMETIGSEMVVLFDASRLTHCNLKTGMPLSPVSLSNLIVHVMSQGDVYYIREKRFEPLGFHS